ncbi:hydroxyacid dehydrogenase [Thalassobacillus pellis]|uniref:hydroxyacid dehydrogenase n=1 Tax=Thalassobacillus pellis TaxID=748008 RepID=UPI00195F5BE9|nr:hydroxyacid dehydrogenase [Thalassobacillus pellis]MBM7554470.1 D-3-phosphoglycerate dehydrogenase [Thalassobacillus pellis]
MKVLITEVIREEGIQQLKAQNIEVQYDSNLWRDKETLQEKIQHVDALIVRNQTQVDEALLKENSELKVIGRLGVGLDNINVARAKEKGIKVVVPRHANATAVAEYVMATLFHANRPIHLANEDVKQGDWNRVKHTGKEISQTTLGLIGLGEIAHRVAKRAKAFGMEVIGYDPFLTEHDHIIAETGVQKKDSIEEVLATADAISIHVPLTDSTKHLISDEHFTMMKPTTYIINSSRGGIIDEMALYQALKNQEIAGAYLDVVEKEPIDISNKLLALENVTFTPHIAGLTNESQSRISMLVTHEVIKLLKGNPSLCVV